MWAWGDSAEWTLDSLKNQRLVSNSSMNCKNTFPAAAAMSKQDSFLKPSFQFDCLKVLKMTIQVEFFLNCFCRAGMHQKKLSIRHEEYYLLVLPEVAKKV